MSDSDLSSEAHPFLGAKEIEIGFARALAVRIGYVGEQGYELYIPQEFAAHVYDSLWSDIRAEIQLARQGELQLAGHTR